MVEEDEELLYTRCFILFTRPLVVVIGHFRSHVIHMKEVILLLLVYVRSSLFFPLLVKSSLYGGHTTWLVFSLIRGISRHILFYMTREICRVREIHTHATTKNGLREKGSCNTEMSLETRKSSSFCSESISLVQVSKHLSCMTSSSLICWTQWLENEFDLEWVIGNAGGVACFSYSNRSQICHWRNSSQGICFSSRLKLKEK